MIDDLNTSLDNDSLFNYPYSGFNGTMFNGNSISNAFGSDKHKKKVIGTYQPPRSSLGLYIIKKIIKFSVDIKLINIEKLHIDMPIETQYFLDKKMMLGDSAVMYSSLHKSLWETIGIPYALDKKHLPIPYIIMGNNLVKGSIFVKPLTKLGVIVSEREKTAKKDNRKKLENSINSVSYTDLSKPAISSSEGGLEEIIFVGDNNKKINDIPNYKTSCEKNNITMLENILTPSEKLIEKISYVLKGNNPVMVFPYDGRSKDGLTPSLKTTAIQAAINNNTPIIPTNVDYFQLNEELDFIEYSGKPYTFKMNHLSRWTFKNLGDICVTFGKPIIPSEISNDRRILGKYVREQCMNLIKIYARNVVSYAMMQDEVKSDPEKLNQVINQTLEKLSSQSNKFVDFTLDNNINDIILKAKLQNKDPRAIKIYGNNIIHYIEGMYDR